MMRVTNAATYRNFTTGVNNVHLALNKSMNKVSSGEQYENAAENPLAYYTGKKIDDQYQDVISKSSLLKDVQNRIYQQELGARDIKDILGAESGAKNQVQYARTATTVDYALECTRQDLLQKQHQIVNDLNVQYEDYYIYGGSDLTTAPFELSADGKTFTFNHKFPDGTKESFVMELTKQTDGSYKFKLDPNKSSAGADATKLLKAMQEQGRIDIGYGTIKDRETLLDTYTGGMNLLTGITSDESLNSADLNDATKTEDLIMDALSKGPLGMVGQAVQVINDFEEASKNGQDMDAAREVMHRVLGETIEGMTTAEQNVSSIYADLGNKYRLIDNMQDRLGDLKISLETQYKEKLGADPYASIMEMFNNQSAYNASLQVTSKLMSSSLFDFVG